MSKVVGQLEGATDQFEIEWKVENFRSLSAEVDEGYNSPMFFFCKSSWYLSLFLYDEMSFSGDSIDLYLWRKDSGPPVSLDFSLFLKKTDGRELIVEEKICTFSGEDDGFITEIALRRSELIDQESVFLPSGVLTVICSMKCDGTQVDKCTGSDVALQTTAYGTPNTKFLHDFEKLLISKEDCDVTLQVKGQKFEAHRNILRARSPVFASMLTHDMNTGVIDIVDCEPEHLPDFLHFLYCGRVDSITSQNACSLYKAADKYDVQDLKSECLAFIKSNLDVDNFCDVITLALQHSETYLNKQATDFFAKNMLNIVVTVKWQAFLSDNPIQGNELIIKGLSAHKCSDH